MSDAAKSMLYYHYLWPVSEYDVAQAYRDDDGLLAWRYVGRFRRGCGQLNMWHMVYCGGHIFPVAENIKDSK